MFRPPACRRRSGHDEPEMMKGGMLSMANGSLMLAGHMALVQIVLVLGGVLLVGAALHDVAARTIPNWVSLALCGLGVLLRFIDHNLLAGLSLGLVVFAVATLCWRRGWM